MAFISSGTTILDAGSFSVSLGSMVHIKTLTASSSSTLSFLHGTDGVVFDSTYPIYRFEFINCHPATDDVDLTFQEVRPDTYVPPTFTLVTQPKPYEGVIILPNGASQIDKDFFKVGCLPPKRFLVQADGSRCYQTTSERPYVVNVLASAAAQEGCALYNKPLNDALGTDFVGYHLDPTITGRAFCIRP